MEILIGTTNPSKVARFQSLLEDYDIRFLTLRDLDICTEPEETGARKLPDHWNFIVKGFRCREQ